jgi:hypothetical protein
MFSTAQPKPAKCSRSAASLTGMRRVGSEKRSIDPSPGTMTHGWVLCGLQARTPAATTRSTPESVGHSRQRS